MSVENTFDWEESVWNPELVHFFGWDKNITVLYNVLEISSFGIVSLIP